MAGSQRVLCVRQRSLGDKATWERGQGLGVGHH